MQLNIKDNIYHALKTLADNKGQSVETFFEQLVRREVGKSQPAATKDSAWATIYERQPRFDSGEHDPQLLRQVEWDMMKAKENSARQQYVERLKSGRL